MAHFAKVLQGVVQQVIVAEPEFFETFTDDSPGQWVQTSYNTKGGVHYGQDGLPDGGTPLRKNFASVGCVYDADRDAFYEPRPFPSWALDEDTCFWQPPVSHPGGDSAVTWDEDAYQSDNTTGWVINT